METNDDVGGSLADVAAAATAGRGVARPWWLIGAQIAVSAAAFSALYGGSQGWRDYAIVAVCLVVLLGLYYWGRRRSGKPTPFIAGSMASNLFLGGVLLAIVAGSLLQNRLAPGAVSTRGIVFAVCATFFGAGLVSAEIFARRSLR